MCVCVCVHVCVRTQASVGWSRPCSCPFLCSLTSSCFSCVSLLCLGSSRCKSSKVRKHCHAYPRKQPCPLPIPCAMLGFLFASCESITALQVFQGKAPCPASLQKQPCLCPCCSYCLAHCCLLRHASRVQTSADKSRHESRHCCISVYASRQRSNVSCRKEPCTGLHGDPHPCLLSGAVFLPHASGSTLAVCNVPESVDTVTKPMHLCSACCKIHDACGMPYGACRRTKGSMRDLRRLPL